MNRLNDFTCLNPRFIAHYSVAPWGFSIYIMEKSGKAFGRIYQYANDSTTVCLDSLSVADEIRRQGVGTELQEIREKIGIMLGATTSCLWVYKDTWMHDWYKRRGYEDWSSYEAEENAIWMGKSLVKNTLYV